MESAEITTMYYFTERHTYKDILRPLLDLREISLEINETDGSIHLIKRVEYCVKAIFAYIRYNIFIVEQLTRDVLAIFKSTSVISMLGKIVGLPVYTLLRVLDCNTLLPLSLILGIAKSDHLYTFIVRYMDYDSNNTNLPRRGTDEWTNLASRETQLKFLEINSLLASDGVLANNRIPRSTQTESFLETMQGLWETPDPSDTKVSLPCISDESDLPEAIGREDLIRDMLSILNISDQRSLMLTGETGVGKTTLVKGLAKFLNENKMHINHHLPHLNSPKIYHLELDTLLSDSSLIGQLSQRFMSVIDEIKSKDHTAIIFVDEIHRVMGAGAGVNSGASNQLQEMFKEHLTGPDIIVIGATTTEEYGKYVEGNSAFVRRFTKFDVPPLSDEAVTAALEGFITKVGEKTGCIFSPEDDVLEAVFGYAKEIMGSPSNLILANAKKIISKAASLKRVDDLFFSIIATGVEPPPEGNLADEEETAADAEAPIITLQYLRGIAESLRTTNANEDYSSMYS